MKLKERLGKARSAGALLLIAAVAATGIGCGQSSAEAGGDTYKIRVGTFRPIPRARECTAPSLLKEQPR